MIDQNFASTVGAAHHRRFRHHLRRSGHRARSCGRQRVDQGGVSNSVGQYFQNIFPGNVIPMQCFDPTALDLYNGYVSPYGTGTIGLTPVMPDREDQTTLRLDHKLTGSQQLSIYYYFDDDNLHRSVFRISRRPERTFPVSAAFSRLACSRST